MTPLDLLKGRFAKVLAAMTDNAADYLDMVRPAQDSKFGDFQANMAMPMAKKLGKNPRMIASEIVERLEWSDILETPQIAGPGFINLTFKSSALADLVVSAEKSEKIGIEPVKEPKTYIIDYSAPNAAKPMHVGHIRSTCIGRALYNILGFLGHKVISDNHLGDWGTQFGMIIYGYRHFLDSAAYEKSPVQELLRLYRLVRQKADADPAVMKDVLAETSKLHHGDEENIALWKSILPNCLDEINKVYDRLGVKFDYTIGESFYNDRLGALVDRFKKEGIARETDGAVGIFLEGEEVPMLIQKSDGAYLYATTDLATLEYRRDTFAPDAILYVFDFRQSHHFEQLFKAAQYVGMGNCELVHIKFGTVLGDDGKAFKTRSGDTVGLESLLDEAERRAGEIVLKNNNQFLATYRNTVHAADIADDGIPYSPKENDVWTDSSIGNTISQPECSGTESEYCKFADRDWNDAVDEKILVTGRTAEKKFDVVDSSDDQSLNAKFRDNILHHKDRGLDAELIQKIARVVGLGALVYADLSQNRESDYVFSFDKMLAMNGNTATYLQYTYTRIRSIFTKGNVEEADLRQDLADGKITLALNNPAERSLALELLKFPTSIAAAARDYKPNILTAYLYDLAVKFSSFFEKCPVLKGADESQKMSRLVLCDLTARTIQKGLNLLGIGTVDWM